MPNDPLDLRLDRAAAALRSDDATAVARIVARASHAPLRRSRNRTPIRLTMVAFTVSLALLALWPRGPHSMAYAQMREATLAAPHSVARTYALRTGREVRTVWRQGDRYALVARSDTPYDAGRVLREERSDGRRKLSSDQFRQRDSVRRDFPFGYRYASIDGDFGLDEDEAAVSVPDLLRAYALAAPKPERVGDRWRYRLPEPTGRYRTHRGGFVVEADAATGRVVEIRDGWSRTTIDYDDAIPTGIFEFRTTEPDVRIIDLDAIRPKMRADMDAGAGAWLDPYGKVWLVYRGSPARPPKVAGLLVRRYERATPYEHGQVVAVAAVIDRRPPETLVVAGTRVPLRRIGPIMHAAVLFQALSSSTSARW